MTGAAMTMGGGSVRLNAGSGSVTDSVPDPSDSAASLTFETDGDRIANNSFGPVDEGDWIAPKAAASTFNSSCTIRAHVDSSTGGGLGAGSDAVDTDLALSTQRQFIVSQSTPGSSSATITFTIKLNGVTHHTVQRTIAAEVT